MKQQFNLSESNKPDKKYMVSFTNPSTGREKTIHFGAFGMSDYLHHKDDDRKELYIQRHRKNEDWNDLTKAGTWSRYILWGEKTLRDSIKEMEKKFNIKINLNL